MGGNVDSVLPFASKRQKGDREKAADSFRGLRFVFISGLLATSVLSLFFAYRWIGEHDPKFLESAQKIFQLQGARIETCDLKIVGSKDFELSDSQASAFDSALKRSQSVIDRVKGKSFFSTDLKDLRDELMSEGWAKRVAVRKVFPNRIEVELSPRRPQFLVRGARQWVVTDREGFAILVVKEIPGTWASLPSVLGFEEKYSFGRTPRELNRQLGSTRYIFSDLLNIQIAFEKTLELQIESLRVEEDPEGLKPLLRVAASSLRNPGTASFEVQLRSENWQKRLQSLQFVLSDLSSRKRQPKKILGQFDSRFFVSSTPNSLEEVERVRRL